MARCGCHYFSAKNFLQFLPQIRTSAYTRVDSTAYSTTLTQEFVNPFQSDAIKEVTYVFPIFDGVSVVAFECTIGKRVIQGVVKEKSKARKEYDEAVQRGETAGLLEQGPTGDVFSMKLGNIPSGQSVLVDITYVGELKHDLGLGGIRYTLPTFISPRYGYNEPSGDLLQDKSSGISVTVDMVMPSESPITNVRSPSHPIDLKLGSSSTGNSEPHNNSLASTTLALGEAALDKDFVLEIIHNDTNQPKALLEKHSGNEDQRALMVTLVPQALPMEGPPPELIIVADQSGSMSGSRTTTLKSALRILLKSLPLETKFNICAFGSGCRLLWPRSEDYTKKTLNEALSFVNDFSGQYGGTETQKAVEAAIDSRDPERNLALILATDGDIWSQDYLFSYLNEEIAKSKTFIRVFPLGIGGSVSSSLIEGVARAGNGFAQTVVEGEKQDAKVIRMLKGALTPDTGSWRLELQFKEEAEAEDYVMVERVSDSLRVMVLDDEIGNEETDSKDANIEHQPAGYNKKDDNERKKVSPPKILQSPQIMPPLYPQSRATIYLLLSPDVATKTLKSVTLRSVTLHNKAEVNTFEMNIPVEQLPKPGTTLHSLAAKRAILELEEGRGWLTHALDNSSLKGNANIKLLKDTHAWTFSELVKAECVRLGEQYQIAGKHTSFVAIQSGEDATSEEQSLDTKSTAQPPKPSVIPAPFATAPAPMATSSSRAGKLPPRKQLASKAPRKAGRYAAEVHPASTSMEYTDRRCASRFLSGRSGAQPPPPGGSGGAKPALDQSCIESTMLEDEDEETGVSAKTASVNSPGAWDPPSPSAVTKLASDPIQRSTEVDGGGLKFGRNVDALHAAPGKKSKKGGSSWGLSNLLGSRRRSSGGPQLRASGPATKASSGSSGGGGGQDELYEDAEVEGSDGGKKLDKLVELQSFDGYWEFDRLFKTVLGIKAGAKPPESVKEEVWATIVAILFLETNLTEEKDVWEFVAEKAVGWLRKEGYADREDGMVKGVWEEARTLLEA